MATLKFVNVEGVDEVVHIGPDRPELTIGRHKDCDLRTNNNTVSRRHARFEFKDGEYLVVDLESANGTYYKREKVSQAVLSSGETVFVGNLPVEFLYDQADQDLKLTVERLTAVEAGGESDEVADMNMTLAVEGLGPVVVNDMFSTQAYAEVPKPTNGYARVPDTVESDRGTAAPLESEPESVLSWEDNLRPLPKVELDSKVKPLPEPPASPASPAQSAQSEPPPDSTVKPSVYVRHSTQDLVSMQDEWITREQELVDRVADLEFQIGERDDEIRRLNGEVAELHERIEENVRLIAGRSDEEQDNIGRIADLERVLTSAEVERMGLEEQMEAVIAENGELKLRLAESESSVGQGKAKDAELDELRRQLAIAVEDAEHAREQVSKLSGIQKELEEVKIANRSYVRRISKLLESGAGRDVS